MENEFDKYNQAVGLLRKACALYFNGGSMGSMHGVFEEISKFILEENRIIDDEIQNWNTEKEKAVANQDFDRAVFCRSKADDLRQKKHVES